MASSSTSSVHKSFKYDVFLSFRGEDTRNTFVGHLYHALQQKSIYTYKDDERIKKGKKISDELIKSTQDSRFHIIVFSKNYASSSWCLEELVKIMECQKTAEQTAYPVFYDVEPTEVRKQSGEFGQVFAKHEKEEAVEKWREALEEAAGLAGWELKNTVDGHEAKFIQKIVEEISLELRSNYFNVDEKLIGMEVRIKDIVSSLEIGLDDVRMIGIKGMGGGGKTTLARAVFDQISIHFEGKSFVENVREISNGSLSGLKSLQEKILFNVLKDNDIKIDSVYDGKNMMKKMMCGRKVLVVLDDVDHIHQLEALAGGPSWFKPGSRIIITTRNEQLLVAHRVTLIRDVSLLSNREALCLFSRYAFGREIPIQGYEELTRQVTRYASGLPLTITVLGSFLCGKNELEWEDAIERLKTIPLKETLEKLELSYIGLEEDYKEIFLDVACIMKGWRKAKAIRALESCGFHARNGLRVLEQRSLITISRNEQLDMHDHIEEMGKNIVRRLHPNEPNRHSRLWIDGEIEDILANDMGTEATTCIQFTTSDLNVTIFWKGLGNMKNLRFLRILKVDSWFHRDFNWKSDEVSQNLQNFPNALRNMSWDGYPFRSLPKTFQANYLVALDIRRSRIVQLWEGGERKVLKKLRFLTFKHSNLKSLDLGLTPNLEKLNLEDCVDLVELHILVEYRLKLKSLNIASSKLRILDLRGIPNLEKLSVTECDDLVELQIPVKCLKLTTLHLSCCKLRTLALGWTPNIKTLSLGGCYNLVELHILIECHLKLGSLHFNHPKLETLGFHGTPNLEAMGDHNAGLNDLRDSIIPNACRTLKLISLDLNHLKLMTVDLQKTMNLKTLCVIEFVNNLVEIHTSVECCLKITSLAFSHSKLRTLDLRGTPNLETLSLVECVDLVELHIPVECCLKLISLDINSSKLRTLDLRGTQNLEKLSVTECDDFVELHIPIECPNLTSLCLSCCKLRTLDFQGALNLEKVHLGECVDLVELHIPIECLKLKYLDLGSSKLRTLDLRGAPNLETISVRGCYALVELYIPNECLKLISLDIGCSKLRTLDLRGTPNLETLSLTGCYDLIELHMGDLCLKLKSINIMGSKLRIFDLERTPNLERLSFTECDHLVQIHAPGGGYLEKLDYLDLSGCLTFNILFVRKLFDSREVGSLSELHLITESLDICPLHNLSKFRFTCLYEEHGLSLIGNLEKLLSLGLSAFTNLESFLQSICGLRYLTKLTLEGSIPEAPKDLDQLECLEELHLISTKIKLLPDSICMLKRLKCLELNTCWLLEKLPEDIGRLQCLEKLILSECVFIRDIPNCICKMKHLEYFHLRYCIAIEKLPEELGCLDCLKELNIEGTNIKHLPQSILELKGVRIVGFRWLLQSYGFTSEIQTSEDQTFCYVEL